VAARVSGRAGEWVTAGDWLFAHTGPVYLYVGGEKVLRRESIGTFIDWVDDLTALALARGEWNNPADSVRIFSFFDEAAEYYADLLDTATGVEEEGGGIVPPSPAVMVHPNPFSGSTEIRFAAPAAAEAGFGNGSSQEARYLSSATPSAGSAVPVTVSIYDVSGRLVRRLVSEGGAGGTRTVTWDGRNGAGTLSASGIYFCRVGRGSFRSSAKILLIR
jgi:hypothetical protein